MDFEKIIEKIMKAKSAEEMNQAVKEALLETKRDEVMQELAPKKEVSTGAKSLGDYAVKNLSGIENLKSMHGSVGTPFGFKANTDIETVGNITEASRAVTDVAQRALMVRDLFGAETISGNALQYYVLNATEGTPAVTAEGAKKPQIHIPNESVTAPLEKIAAFFKESDELTNDAQFLVSSLNNRGIYEHNLAIEKYLVTKLLATSGIQSVAYATSIQDTIFDAMTKIQIATGYTADAVVINPTDYQALRLAKDSNGQYFGGGFFFGAYANGGVQQQPGIWGLPTVVTPNVAQGTAIVGAFKPAGSVVSKAGEGLRVEVSNSNEDDFINNLVTVRIEERIALACRVPAAFAKVALA